MLRFLTYFGGVALLLGLAAFLMIRFTLIDGRPPEEGRLPLSGLQQEVKLTRSESGRVTITAFSAEDGIHALGFVHARDRLWQLQRFKWAAASEWAAVFGDAFLPADRLTAALLHPLRQQPGVAFRELPDRQQQLLESYAAGINAYIEQAGARYPLQFTLSETRPQLWTATDVLQVFVLQQWLFQTGWQQDLAYAAILPQLPDELLPFLFDEARRDRLTDLAAGVQAAGKPAVFELLEADRMLRINLNASQKLAPVRSLPAGEGGFQLIALQSGTQAFGFWYDVTLDLNAPGEPRRLTGFSLPGAPLFWAATNETDAGVAVRHGFESRDILLRGSAPPDSAAGRSMRALKRADGSEIPFRFTSLPKKESRPGGFRLDDAAAEAIFRRPDASTGFDLFFESMMRHALRAGATPPAPARPAALRGFQTALYPVTERSAGAGAVDILADTRPGASVDARLPKAIDRAFFERQVNRDRLTLARELAGLIEPYVSEARLQLSYDYLANWDGRYDSYAVAASIVEGSLLESSRRTFETYISESDFRNMERLGFIGSGPGRQLVRAHLLARGQGSASAVDDAFFARRVLDAVNRLQEDLGEEPYTWRWASRYRFQYGDQRLCPGAGFRAKGQGAVADSLIALPEGWFSGRRNGCRQVVLENPYPVSGQQQLMNAALGYRTPEGFRVAAITTGFLQQFEATDAAAPTVRLVQLPGYAGHPFSPYYGSNVAPDLRELRIEVRPPETPSSSVRELYLHP